MLPSQFLQKYTPIAVNGDVEWKYVPIRRYVSGEPRKKNFVKQAFWDFECFVKKRDRYEPAKGNFTGHHEWHAKHFLGHSLAPKTVPITWAEMALCFYGKGSPATFQAMLRVVDYYLEHADIPLDRLGWGHRMTLKEYGHWYFGLDCNGFAGAYYAEQFPGVGIDGNDHINYLKSRDGLTMRASFADVRAGDMLVREGSSGGGKRHVALIEHCLKLTDKTASAVIVQSASSRDGLSAEAMNFEKVSKSDSYGDLNWRLKNYHDFHYILGPK